MVDLARVRKLVVAATGFAVLIAGEFGLDSVAGVDDQVAQIFDAVVAILTTVGVYKVPNKGGTRGV